MSLGYVHTGSCVYLPGQRWALRMIPCPDEDGGYQNLLDHHHRRSGWIVYRPVCHTCQACRPIRVPVSTFKPSRSQRRTLRRNADVTLQVGPPEPTEEKRLLHNRYVSDRFGKADAGLPSLDAYAEVFGSSPVTTLEMTYRVGDRLVGVGIVDALPDVISSVYFFFDPDEGRRSLGTYSALREIQYAEATGRGFVYFGYYIAACREMRYKARFRPCELLGRDGVWRPFEPQVDAQTEPRLLPRVG
ncbi:arginyltransferase [Planctomycetota bacterium]|nr:arginyltransferase [Planctomycetota bacterium]